MCSVYKVSTFSPVLCLEGHRGIIYDIIWSGDDITLTSASADGLVKYVMYMYRHMAILVRPPVLEGATELIFAPRMPFDGID